MILRTDIAGDPGLQPTLNHRNGSSYVGSGPTDLDRFAHDEGLNKIVSALYRGFGPQYWWPAETPFEVIVGAVLTQSTAWRNVELALERLRAENALTPGRLLAMDPKAREELIRPAGYFRVKAAKLEHISTWYLAIGGLAALRERELESLRTELLNVWGVGPETADSILCYAASRRTVVVDAYTRRILSRHELFAADAPYEDIRAYLQRQLIDSQAVYEEFHALCVRAGYDNCKPTARCEGCPAEQ